ncbi:MAG: DUF3971 domain-containing protein [Acidocella sp.]|nr:DUF3971 domain-containing protein [Acidocella sp.]
MKRLPGQAGRTIGYFLHHTGVLMLEIFLVLALGIGGLAYRLSEGPIQIPWLTTKLANLVSGQGLDIQIKQAALAWGGFKNGPGVPLYFQLGGVTARNAAGVALVTIPSARLVFLPAALVGSGAPIAVTSQDALLAGSNVPVSLQANIILGFMRVDEADLNFTLGSGLLGAGDITFPISGGSFNVAISPGNVMLQQGKVTLMPVDGSAPVIGFSGNARLKKSWEAQVNATVDQVQAAQLPSYWPAALVPLTRTWVTRNITAGLAKDADFTFGLSAAADLTSVKLTQASGHFNGEHVTVGWVPKAAPITGVDGVFTLVDMDDILITATAGQLGGIKVTGGQMKIGQLTQKDQPAEVSVPVSATVAAAMAVLNAPPLNLLKTAPPILLQANGAVVADVTANFPLKNDLKLEQVDLHVAAHLTGVTLPTPLEGLEFKQGDVALQATIAGLQAKGTATLDGQAAEITATAGFDSKQPVINFSLQTTAGNTMLRRFGLDSGSRGKQGITGTVPLSVQIMQDPHGQSAMTLKADLTNAALGVTALGWSKPLGSKGSLDVAARLDEPAGFSIQKISAHAPGLAIEAAIAPAVPERLNISQLEIGATVGSGYVVAPEHSQGTWLIDLSGPALDVTGIVNPSEVNGGVKKSVPAASPATGTTAKAAPPKPAPPSGPLWRATLKFNRLLMAAAPAPALQNLVFTGDGQGGSLFDGQASATGEANQTVKFSLIRTATPPHLETLHVATDDGGYLLRCLDEYQNLQGGVTSLDATYDDQTDLNGQITIHKFRLLRAPILGKILQGLSLYGVLEATSGPGLEFDQLTAPFAISNEVLTLKNARAFSSSLGLTASGTIGLDDGTIDLDTTVIPAYALNSAPGKIPFLGKLFSAEKGGGLFAVRASITGQRSDPSVTINPLSALTPGLLRSLFGLGSSNP